MNSTERKLTRTNPLDIRSSFMRIALVMIVLGICALAVDFAIWGPVREWVWQTWVVRPIEQTWGFHAKWQHLEELGDQLVVTDVTENGPFALAGIRPGAIIPHGRCAWDEIFGGFYGMLSKAGPETQFRIMLQENQYPHGVLVHVSRRPAT